MKNGYVKEVIVRSTVNFSLEIKDFDELNEKLNLNFFDEDHLADYIAALNVIRNEEELKRMSEYVKITYNDSKNQEEAEAVVGESYLSEEFDVAYNNTYSSFSF